VDDALYARLDAIASAPAIFQQRIVGADVRVTVVGDRVVSAVEVESEDGVDYRRGAAYRAGASVYRSHALPADVASMSLRAAALCGHVLSGIDWKAGKDGYVILEANSAPVYLDIEHKTGAPITEAVVAWLEQHIG
jgi:glutathione synthase/RimK-type ligase-like ATP-grasp enzyme